MSLPKNTLSRLLLVTNNSYVTPVEKELVKLLVEEKAEEAIKLLQSEISVRTQYGASHIHSI